MLLSSQKLTVATENDSIVTEEGPDLISDPVREITGVHSEAQIDFCSQFL